MLGLAFRMTLAMMVVIALMVIAARIMRNRVMPQPKTGNPLAINILARQALGKGVSLVVAQVGDKQLVLGVGEKSVTPISEIDIVDLDDRLDADWTTHSGDELVLTRTDQTRKTMIEQLREMTTRRS